MKFPIDNSMKNEAAYAQGFYYILLIQTEYDGLFKPVTDFVIGDAVFKFATPHDAEVVVKEKLEDEKIYGYRIVKVSMEEVKTVENKDAIEDVRTAIELWSKVQEECRQIEKGRRTGNGQRD